MARSIISNIVVQRYENANSFEFCKYTNIRFFEIVYFKEGTGRIKINGNTTSYEPDSFFVFIPDDVYIVEVETETSTTTVKFLKSIFSELNESNSKRPASDWFRKIENVINCESYQHRKLDFQIGSDKTSLVSLIELLYEEYQMTPTYDISIIENSLSILLHIITRNLKYLTREVTSQQQISKIQDIIDYIHTHIFEPELLTNTMLADKFHMAEKYVGQYFKKHMNMSIKKYILNYKLKLVERRLKYTDLQLSKIADELGFTDASHLNKTFMAYKGMSVGAFKSSIKLSLE